MKNGITEKTLRLFVFVIMMALVAETGCKLEREDPNAKIEIECAMFEGGYGIDWHKSVARQYEKLHPNIRINLWGDPRVDEKLKPRVLRRNPPELASSNLPIWKLILGGKLYPMDEALDSPAYGQNMTWREAIIPGLLANFQYKSKTYSVPTNLSAWVCWYDRRMFRKYGWEAPKTWGEFTALCDRMKAQGIAPLAFQGKYPVYAWSTLLVLYQRLVPIEKWYEMQDVKPGAFEDPAFIEAARLLQEMATKYFQPGALAMTHTESQLEWVNGRAAMVFCGLWLKNEMKQAIPPGFEMACFPVPMVAGGKGDPRAVYAGGGENFFIFSESKHPKEALDFLKFMVSLQSARTYITKLDTLSTVKDSAKGLPISPALQSAVEVIDDNSRLYADRLGGLYLEFAKTHMPDALADLISGKITPEQFGKRLETAIEKVRRNPEIYKPAPMGVPQ